MEAIYERQSQLHLRKIEIASVVGCGGTGFWTAVFLAMSGVEELILVDDDIIDVTNLNRLPVAEAYINYNKLTALRDYVKTLRRNVRFELQNMKIKSPEDCTFLRGVVFCCTDNLKSQQLIQAYCRKNELPYQRIGYDGTILNVSTAFPLSFQEETSENAGYTTTPSWVVPAVLAAALGVASKMYKPLCIMDDISGLCIQQSSFLTELQIEKATERAEERLRDDGYGYCGDCDRVDTDDGYGYCPDCDRVDVRRNSEYGYCPDCERVDPNEHCEGCNRVDPDSYCDNCERIDPEDCEKEE